MLSFLSSLIWGPNEKSNYRRRFIRRLNNKGLDGEQVVDLIKRTDSCVAGSFPLQLYLHEFWEDSDLDIFTSEKTAVFGYFRQYFKPIKTSSHNYKYGKMEVIQQFEEYQTPKGFRVQVIYSSKFKSDEKGKITDKVPDEFDFEFCMNTFDGEDLKIRHPETIKSRSCTYDFKRKAPNMKTYERMLKYKERGFYLENHEEFVDHMIRKGDPEKIESLIKKVRAILNIKDEDLSNPSRAIELLGSMISDQTKTDKN